MTGNTGTVATTNPSSWASVQPYAEIEVEGTHVVLCHYASWTWRNLHRGWWNLHGQSHGGLRRLPRQVDVGVYAWHFRPVTLLQITAERRASPVE